MIVWRTALDISSSGNQKKIALFLSPIPTFFAPVNIFLRSGVALGSHVAYLKSAQNASCDQSIDAEFHPEYDGELGFSLRRCKGEILK